MPLPSPLLSPSPLLYPAPSSLVVDPPPVETVAEVITTIERLMAFRRRQSGFASGNGGNVVPHFTASTTPTLADVEDAATRKAGELDREFDAGADHDDLVTIAALRAAIELELGCPNPDEVRIRGWRDQLREYVKRAENAGDGDGGGVGDVPMAARWYFGRDVCDHVPGSEVVNAPVRCRRSW